MAKQKSAIPIVHSLTLANDVRTAIVELKTRVKCPLPRSQVFR